MALVSLRELVTDASRRGYAVGPQCCKYGYFAGHIAGCEENGSPVILSVAEGHFHLSTSMSSPCNTKGRRKSRVPVAVHLDHGQTFRHSQSLRSGFTSVSRWLPAITRGKHPGHGKSRMAHAVGVSVRGELPRYRR